MTAQESDGFGPNGDGSDLSPQALRDALESLRLHQTELAMQNEELRRAKAELEESNARYVDLYELAPIGYCTVKANGLLAQLNLAVATLLGVTRSELVGRRLARFIAPEHQGSYYRMLKQLLAVPVAQTAQPVSCELLMHKGDGATVWVSLQAIAVVGDQGTTVFRMVLSDITARKCLEERLIRSESDTKAILDGASDAIFINDPQGRFLYVNHQAVQLLGFSRDELLGKCLTDITPAEDFELTRRMLVQLMTSGTLRYEPLLLRRDGSAVAAELSGVLLSDGNGFAACRDITARKQTEALHLANNKFRDAILDSVPAEIAVLDNTGSIVAVNQRWREFALNNNVASDQLASKTQIGANYLEVCQVAGQSDVDGPAALAYDGILRVMNGSLPSFQLEYPCHTATQRYWFLLTATPLHVGDQAVVVTHTDITQRRQQEQAAKEASEDKFRLVADNTSDGIVIFGADKRIAYASPSYFKQLGIDAAEAFNGSLDLTYAIIHPEDRDALIGSIERAIESKESNLLLAYRVQHRLGHYIWRETSAKLQYDGSGNFLQACVVARDITQRRQAQEELRIAAVAFETQEAMMVTDANTVIFRVNRAFTRITGYTAEEAVGQTPRLLQSGRHNQDFYRQLWDTVRRTGVWQGEIWDRHKDGQESPKWLTITAVSRTDGAISHYISAHFDLSERKRAEAAMQEMNRNLTQSRQQLRRLVALNETTLEKEKRHIAREVHDELGQVLTALRMDLSLAIIRHASSVPDLLDALKGMKTQVDRAILGVRNVATSLRPAALDLGLVPAIEWLCQEFTRHGGVVCELQVPEDALVLDASRAVVLFRIVQESLNNIGKYARATQVVISLARRDQELWLEVRDNGLGFDMAAVAQRGTLGLLGMRERVLALGGRVEVNSAPGQGTVITVVIALDADVVRDLA